MVQPARLAAAVAHLAALACAAGCGSSKNAPVVSVPSVLYGNVGTPVTIDASGSHDPAGTAVTFAWTLATSPGGSSATLAEVSQGVVRLEADKDGVYVVHVVVTGAAEESRDVAVTVWRALHPLTFRPIDVEYDRPLDRIVAVSDQPPALHLYDAPTRQDVVLTLPLAPTCVSVSPDGKVAAVGHDAWVSIVDLEAQTVLKTWPTAVPVGDVVVTDLLTLADHTARIAFLYPYLPNRTQLHAIDASNGAEIGVSGLGSTVHAYGCFKLQPGSNHLLVLEYLTEDLLRWDFDPATGALTEGGTAPHHDEHDVSDDLWVSEDGTQVLMGAGTRFRTADLTYSGKVPLPEDSVVAWADSSAAAGQWLVQPTGNLWNSDSKSDLSLWTVDAKYLTGPERTDLPKLGLGTVAHPLHGRFVFFDKAGTTKISIAQIDAKAGIVDDLVILTF